MLRAFRERFAHLFEPNSTTLDEHCSIQSLSSHFPAMEIFIERKYGTKIVGEDHALSLKEFCARNHLPPAPVVFMEIQLDQFAPKVTQLTPPQAKSRIEQDKTLKILDVREEWETHICRLLGSALLTASLLDEILEDWPKDTPILVYCHHGVRSLDAAIFLADRGFTKMMTLIGGIDAWSTQVDDSVVKYDGQYC